MSSRLVYLLDSAPFKKPGSSTDFEKVKGECYLFKRFCFKDKDPRFTRLKTSLALRLLSKGLFYIRAMMNSIF
jgi:hypothetical protein